MVARVAHNASRWSAGLRIAATFAVLLTVGLLLCGCDASLARTPRMSGEWSKGLPLGLASLNNRPALAVDDGSVYVLWADLEHDLRFLRLNDRASFQRDLALDLDVTRPQKPLMAMDSEGQLHLAWFDKDGTDLRLMYARISTEGEVLQGTTPLSTNEMRTGRSSMALEPRGKTVELFWSDNTASRAGLYHSSLSWAGELVQPQELLVEDGLEPAAQADGHGYVHLAWRTERQAESLKFEYAAYDPQRRALGPALEVGEPVIDASLLGGPAAGGKFDGPNMGLEGDSVYVAWSLEIRPRGQLSAFTFYQAFPQPELGPAGGQGALDYVLPEITEAPVHVRGADPALTSDPYFLAGNPDVQALACFTQAFGQRNQEMLQSAVNNLHSGQIVGFEVVSATPAASLKPNIAADGQGQLHLIWIDTAGFDRYRVIYASTAPQVQAVLNPTTVAEAVSQFLELSFGALTLIGFLPLYLMWAVPAFLILLVFNLATHESALDQPGATTVLWVAVVVHALVKLGTAGGALERLNTGGLLTTPLLVAGARWLAPLLVTGLAILLMQLYIRRSESKSMFAAFFVYMLADAILFTFVYLTPLLLLG